MMQEKYHPESLTGKMAYSKAGHDKGALFVITGEDAECVLLADGRHRTAASPKKKNKKHIQPVTHLPAEVAEILADPAQEPDVRIRKAIRLFQKM